MKSTVGRNFDLKAVRTSRKRSSRHTEWCQLQSAAARSVDLNAHHVVTPLKVSALFSFVLSIPPPPRPSIRRQLRIKFLSKPRRLYCNLRVADNTPQCPLQKTRIVNEFTYTSRNLCPSITNTHSPSSPAKAFVLAILPIYRRLFFSLERGDPGTLTSKKAIQSSMLCMYIGEGMVSCSSREVSYRSVSVRPKNTSSSCDNRTRSNAKKINGRARFRGDRGVNSNGATGTQKQPEKEYSRRQAFEQRDDANYTASSPYGSRRRQ